MKSFYVSLEKQFKKFIAISFCIHLLVFLISLVMSYNFSSKPKIIKGAVRVDMVGLPDLMVKNKVSSKKKKKIKKTPKIVKKKSKKKIVKKKTIKKKQTESKKEKKITKEQTAKSQEAAIQRLKSESQTPSKKLTYKGEKISKGSSSEGEINSVLIYGYFTRVKAHINVYWNLPKLLADKNLKSEAFVEINENGYVVKIQLEKSSGNEAFDQIVINTIRDASPFPSPPLEIRSVLKQGVVLRFPD